MKITIVQPQLDAVSETFLRAHAEELPASVTVVHNIFQPSIDGRPTLSDSLGSRIIRKVGRLVRGKQWDWEITTGLLAAFRRSKPDAVLAEYGPTGVAVLDACRLARLPLIVHFHGYDASVREVLAEHKHGYQRLWHDAAAIIAVSRAMEQKLIGLGAPADKLARIPCGVVCKLFRGANPSAQPPVFLSTGRFVEKKAPHLTILAFVEAWKQFPDARLRMIGDGPLLSICKQIVAGLGLQQVVKFLGAQPHAVVQREMQASRAFLQHSIEASNGDCEGTPVAVIEAGAAGLPVIATMHAGIPDVVVHGETGLLVHEGDVHGMAGYIRDLIRTPQLASQLGAAAMNRVNRHFTMERSIGRLAAVIERCVHGLPPTIAKDDAAIVAANHRLANAGSLTCT